MKSQNEPAYQRTSVINKAKLACEGVGHNVKDHFPDARKKVSLGSGAERDVDDIILTRYACYLVAQNGDPRKEQVAFAQTYFAVQTRKAELIQRAHRQQCSCSQDALRARYRTRGSACSRGREKSRAQASQRKEKGC